MRFARRIVPALALLGVFACASPASAAPRRFALLVGENIGANDDATLRYAESDAQRLARVLRDFGGFQGEDLVALDDVTAEEMRGALISMNSRIREVPNATLFVFYSGHADAEALHLRGSRLSLDEVRSLVHGSPAAARVLVIDACRSGAVTRVKGGHPAPSFAVDVDDKLAAEGMAILTSSAAGEDSQESDRIGASFFTHYLVSGLVGAADDDGDGTVTLDEAFHYASERTLVATAGTMSGPQHPTYRFELGGQGALVLTRPGLGRERFGVLAVPSGTWLVQRSSEEGAVVAEIAGSTAGRKITLPEGRYFVSRRERDHLLEGSFKVASGGTTDVSPRTMREVAYAQVVRKGGGGPTHTWSSYAAVTGRSSLLGLGPAYGVETGARLDLRPVTLDVSAFALRGGTVTHVYTNRTERIASREIGAKVTALRVFDLDRWSIGVGGAAGASRFDRDFEVSVSQTMPPPMVPPQFEMQSIGAFAGPSVAVETRLWRAFHARVESSWVAYTLEMQEPPQPGPGVHPPHQLTVGLFHAGIAFGVWF